MKRKWTEEQRKKFKATMKAKKSAKLAPKGKDRSAAAIVFLRRAIAADPPQATLSAHQLNVQLALAVLEGRL